MGHTRKERCAIYNNFAPQVAERLHKSAHTLNNKTLSCYCPTLL